MVKNMLQARKDFSRFGFSLLAIGGITVIMQLLLSLMLRLLPEDSAVFNLEILFWIVNMGPMYLVAVPVGYLLMQKITVEPVQTQKLTVGRFLLLMLISMPLLYGGNLIGTLLSLLLSGGSAQNALNDILTGKPLYLIIFTVLLAPFLEEFIFRKQLVDRLGKYGEKTTIFFSGITFGLFHMNLFQFFYAFGLGVIFAYVYTRTRMLRYSVIMHMIINFMGAVIAPAIVRLSESILTVDPESIDQFSKALPAMIITMLYSMTLIGLCIAGLVMLIIRWKKRVILPASHELLSGTVGKYVYRNPGMILFILFCLIMIVLALFR